MTFAQRTVPWLLATCLFGAMLPERALAQVEPERLDKLRRDQEEILRKAERMRALMERLQQRYQREGKQEQLALLQQGLAHLDRKNLLRDVAAIRDDLAATALSEALRKQQLVVDELEQLLNILLERNSVENLDEAMRTAAERAATAAELERRQAELQAATNAALRGEPSPAEQQLQQALQDLADQQRNEAERNAMESGSRRPFLENALQRIEGLLRQQQRLEQGLQAQQSGRDSQARQRQFDLGEVVQRTRELNAQLREEARQGDMRRAAADLERATAGNDPEALQAARERFQRLLDDAPQLAGGAEGPTGDPQWSELRREFGQTPSTPPEAGRERLAELARSGQQVAEQRAAQARDRNAQDVARVQDAARRLAEALERSAGAPSPSAQGSDSQQAKPPAGQDSSSQPQAGQPSPSQSPAGQPQAGQPQAGQPQAAQPTPEQRAGGEPPRPQDPASAPAAPTPAQSTAAALREGDQRLSEAQAAAERGNLDEARAKAEQALAAFERARSQDRRDNPEPQQEAARMAAEATAAANELRNAPSAQAAEQTASEQLREAANAQRQAEAGLEPDPQSGRPGSPEAARNATAASRQQLEAARSTLQQALAQSNSGREQTMQQAAERQAQLQQQAQQLAQQMQQAEQHGNLTDRQRQAAEQAMQQAQQAMQQAQQQLQNGQQASAAARQQQAAEQLQQAGERMAQNRPQTDAQREALREQAQRQQQLAEDILKLAKELQETENQQAKRAVEQAADAAQRAQQAMEQGNEADTQQQQERAREKLEEAQRQLEEEKDRYQDLRQEELLFKMKEELTAFLDKQRPISAATLELQEAAKGAGLSRPARRRANQLGEEETELAGKIEFLVNALTEEGNLVYKAVLAANLEDLREVANRLSARTPDPGTYTTMLQQDVERRTTQLLEALERERKRREQERQDRQQQQQQQQSQQSRNRFNQQRQQLVSLIAELEMLKQLGNDTRRATDDLRTLIEVRADELISESEVALIERLAHRHAEITKLFLQIKAGVEQAMQQGQSGGDEEGQGGRGR